ncbi:hypothetical protein EQG63_03550 [Flavobacterium amnicola]|uniref:Uncharacterized protein n=1 Tax=Flavobacterium amnicola TaxID=2506422 RepID=A0A4Q1K6Z9_9FLAO|nr:hypothetical protein [Flavobacterium amnicola]RXR21024.1 hypothetical protein EQG63_03550 [Flavobacterium amnicola]
MVFDLEKEKVKFLQKDITALAKTSKGELVIAEKQGSIFKRTKSGKLIKKDTVEGSVFKILIDKNDNLVVVSKFNIRFKNQNFVPDKKSKMYNQIGKAIKAKYLIPMDVVFLDKEQRVWFGYDAGEWGGTLCFFDLNSKEFYSDESLSSLYDDKYDVWEHNSSKLFKEFPEKMKIIGNDTLIKFPHNLDISNIKGVAQNEKGDIFISESLMHFSFSSKLVKMNKTLGKDFYKSVDLSDVLEHKVYKDTIRNYYDTSGEIKTFTLAGYKESLEYLGGVTFNPYDKHIYYYTNNGFWKFIEKVDGCSKEFVFKPWIIWTPGLANSVGYQMNVIKFEFIGEKEIVFLSSNNGIGYFDGKSVTYFK